MTRSPANDMMDEFDAAVSRLRVRAIEQVIVVLETCGPVGDVAYGLTNTVYVDALMTRLRALRGKIHGCAPNEWRETYDALQETTAQESAPGMSAVQTPQTPAHTRREATAPHSRPKKTRRVKR